MPFETEQSVGEVAARSPQVKTERPRVLVVEDDPAHREYLIEALLLLGYEPLPVGTAEEAEFAVKHGSLHAALVDVFLPGRSGPSLISRLRGRFPDAVLVGVSALKDASTARQCKSVGADRFLGKPVLMADLELVLQSDRQSWH